MRWRQFPINAKVRGKVVNLVPYGAFIELEEGVEGLVHVTEMSWTKRITKPGGSVLVMRLTRLSWVFRKMTRKFLSD